MQHTKQLCLHMQDVEREDAYTAYEKKHTTSMHKIFSLTYEHSGEKKDLCAVF